MQLPREGREYLHVSFAGLPTGATVEASFDDGLTWDVMQGTDEERRILIAGPDLADPDDAVVIAEDTRLKVRITDNPEIIIRSGGQPIKLI